MNIKKGESILKQVVEGIPDGYRITGVTILDATKGEVAVSVDRAKPVSVFVNENKHGLSGTFFETREKAEYCGQGNPFYIRTVHLVEGDK